MRKDPISDLARIIARSLKRIGVTQEAVLSGAIQFTTLDWMAPPLLADDLLEGLPFRDYMDQMVPWVDADQLHMFWIDALAQARSNPANVLGEDGWRGLSKIMPTATPGVRNLWLPKPSIPLDDSVGVQLSLDVAHLARMACKPLEFVENHDDYYVVLEDDIVLGVKGGVPAWPSDFDMPLKGMIPEFLTSSRGELWTGCDYGLLAKLRSTVWEHRSKLDEFQGLDWALQALRILGSRQNPEQLLAGLERAAVEGRKRELDLAVLRNCQSLLSYPQVSDGRKVEGLRGMLVPSVITNQRFRRDFYAQANPPPFLKEGAMEKIAEALRSLIVETGGLDAAN